MTDSNLFLYAAKYVDVDSNVPKFSYLRSLTNYCNSIHEFSLMERVSTYYSLATNFLA